MSIASNMSVTGYGHDTSAKDLVYVQDFRALRAGIKGQSRARTPLWSSCEPDAHGVRGHDICKTILE